MNNYEEIKNELINKLITLYSSKRSDEFLEMFEGELVVLAYLYRESNEISPSNISTKFEVSRARATMILNALKNKGYVELIRKKDDRRKIIINLTDTGKNYITEKLAILNEKIINFIKEFSAEKTQTLISLLNDIIDIIIKKQENNK